MISQENEHLKHTSLSIGECPKFELFPKWGLSASRLQHFDISKLENLKQRHESMHVCLSSLYKLSINDCPQLESFSGGGLSPSLRNSKFTKNYIKTILYLHIHISIFVFVFCSWIWNPNISFSFLLIALLSWILNLLVVLTNWFLLKLLVTFETN